MSITHRHLSIDLARGFTVFIMPGVHSVMLYSTPAVKQSGLGTVLGFLAEGPGAELFMLLMGLSVTLGRPKSAGQILKRVGILLMLGYLLNFLKFVLPLEWGLLPVALLKDNGIATGAAGMWQLLVMGDILQFAGIAYLLTAALYRLKHYWLWAIGIALMVAGTAPLLWDTTSSHAFLNYLLTLLTGKPPQAFFPVFPWLVYPLVGLVWGHFLKHLPPARLYGLTACIGMVSIVLGLLIRSHEPLEWETDFYRTGPGGVLYHIGIVLLWLCGCQLAAKYCPKNLFFDLLQSLSKNITRVYIIQWTIVCWLVPLFGYQRLGIAGSVLGMLVTTIVAFALSGLMGLAAKLSFRKTLLYE